VHLAGIFGMFRSIPRLQPTLKIWDYLYFNNYLKG
jgi:hypothetical protein